MSIFSRFARKTAAPAPVSKTKTERKPVNSEAGIIRAWARENGVEIGERGRVSAEVRAAYAAAK